MTVDSISLEVFKNLFSSVAEEMGLSLQRAGFSPNIRERLDFSCAVFDHEGRMVSQAAHIPVHLGSMPASVEYALRHFPILHKGDIVILNDPYHGGTHLPDITMVSPIFAGEELVYFVASRAHHADVGGMSPGSLPLSTELYQEGLIIPPVKLRDSGKDNEALLRLITANSRAPKERLGDLQAQQAAQRVGERRLLALLESHGLASLRDHALALQDYSRRLTEATIGSIPDGEYDFADALEGDGQCEYRIPVVVKVKVCDRSMIVDFCDSAAQVLGNVNAVEAIVRSATWYTIRTLAEEEIPMNHGCFQPVKVLTRFGSFLNPKFPAAVVVGNTETGQRITDAVLGALAKAMPDRIPAASQGTMNNMTVGGWLHNGEQYVYYETIGGGHGAGPGWPGVSGRHCHMTNTLNTPIEALEFSYPIRVLRYGLRQGSGGVGRYSGGEGVIREYEFLGDATVTLNCERRIIAPYGLAGGEQGGIGQNTIILNGQERSIGGKCTIRLGAGDRLRIETPGGGGWGKAAG